MNPNASDIVFVNSLIEIAVKGSLLQMQMKAFYSHVLKQRASIAKHIHCALNCLMGFSFVMNVWVKLLASSLLPNFYAMYLNLFFQVRIYIP